MPQSGYPGLTQPPQPPQDVPENVPGVFRWAGNIAGWLAALHRWALSVQTIVNNIVQGKINATGTVTLTAGAATTTITDARITAGSYIGFMPRTANAALALSLLRVTSRTKGSATITHGNDPATDKTFTYCVIG